MHTKILTRRDFLGLLDFLEGALGFNLGIVCALVGLGKFGLFIDNIALQRLAFLHSVPELLMDLTNPGLVFLVSGLFLCRSLLGFCQRLLEGLHLGRCSYKISWHYGQHKSFILSEPTQGHCMP